MRLRLWTCYLRTADRLAGFSACWVGIVATPGLSLIIGITYGCDSGLLRRDAWINLDDAFSWMVFYCHAVHVSLYFVLNGIFGRNIFLILRWPSERSTGWTLRVIVLWSDAQPQDQGFCRGRRACGCHPKCRGSSGRHIIPQSARRGDSLYVTLTIPQVIPCVESFPELFSAWGVPEPLDLVGRPGQ